VGAAEAVDPVRVRQELRALEIVLDRAVAAVSAPNPGFVLAGAPHSRGYLLKGTGLVVVIPPRRLPAHRSMVFRSGRSPAGSPKGRADRVMMMRSKPDPGLRDLEAQVEAFQIEAERQRLEAERAFQEMMRRLVERMATAETAARGSAVASEAVPPPGIPGPPGVTVPRAPAAPETPPPASAPDAPDAPLPPPAPPAPPIPVNPGAPWFFWVEEELTEPEPRAPERLVTEVQEALVGALETHGPALTTVRGDETISVVVDFVAGTPFLDEDARPARSLTLRVRKRDLDDRRAGRLAPEELRRRIEAAEY
jgi:hypothetical protein